jgi:hypothetical protein
VGYYPVAVPQNKLTNKKVDLRIAGQGLVCSFTINEHILGRMRILPPSGIPEYQECVSISLRLNHRCVIASMGLVCFEAAFLLGAAVSQKDKFSEGPRSFSSFSLIPLKTIVFS